MTPIHAHRISVAAAAAASLVGYADAAGCLNLKHFVILA